MLMHRMFWSFPNSWPGAALLLLRVSASSAILVLTLPPTVHLDAPQSLVVAAGWLSAAFVLAGIWTPIASGVLAVDEAAQALAGAPEILAHTLVAAIATSLIFLGPGAWSIDAHVYGRKRLI
jgi:hypothetical protein